MSKDEPNKKGPAYYQRQNALVRTINAITPTTYQLKQPALYDYYEGEDPIDWTKLKNENPLAVAFQATFGRRGRHVDGKPDRSVSKFVQQSLFYHVKYGLYHFLTPNSITEQADFYIKTVDSLGGLGNMPPIVDIEWDPGYKYEPHGVSWAYQIKTWLDIVEKYFRVKPVIYTSAKYWSFTCDRYGNPPIWSNDYPLWTAGYPFTAFVDANKTTPKGYIPKGWASADLWQYAETGRSRGYSANDLNLIVNRDLIK